MAHPCLPVSKRRKTAPPGFDDVEHMDASDYLSRVAFQASTLPNHFDALEENDAKPKARPLDFPTGSAAALSYLVDRSRLKPAPSPDHLPQNPDVWIDQTLYQFSKLRLYLENLRLRGVGGKEDPQRIAHLPPMKDSAAWLAFCVGHDAAQGNAGAYFDDDDDSDKEEIKWEKHAPTAQLMLQMDQVMVRAILHHLSHFCVRGWSILLLAPWIYGLLARLEKPLHRDDAAMLYQLVKTLANYVRPAVPAKFPQVASTNVLLTILTVYFEQGSPNVMKVDPNP